MMQVRQLVVQQETKWSLLKVFLDLVLAALGP
jgi:hypothetical protein